MGSLQQNMKSTQEKKIFISVGIKKYIALAER